MPVENLQHGEEASMAIRHGMGEGGGHGGGGAVACAHGGSLSLDAGS